MTATNDAGTPTLTSISGHQAGNGERLSKAVLDVIQAYIEIRRENPRNMELSLSDAQAISDYSWENLAEWARPAKPSKLNYGDTAALWGVHLTVTSIAPGIARVGGMDFHLDPVMPVGGYCQCFDTCGDNLECPRHGDTKEPETAVTYNAVGERRGWHLEMSGDTITALVVNGRVLISPDGDKLGAQLADQIQGLVSMIDQILED